MLPRRRGQLFVARLRLVVVVVAELHIRAEMLRAALAQLPDDQRAAVELQLAGWPPDRIAASLGRSPAAVRMLRHRAMTRLRDLLRHEIEFEIDTPSGGGAR
jgi:DNA-directed RNA polymerase specialized sigma24 family protein